jgi:hypothetical protein
MVPRPRSGRLISSCDLSAFALLMTFTVFAVLVFVMVAEGNGTGGRFWGRTYPESVMPEWSAISRGAQTGTTP